jgi:hypothetical protein
VSDGRHLVFKLSYVVFELSYVVFELSGVDFELSDFSLSSFPRRRESIRWGIRKSLGESLQE